MPGNRNKKTLIEASDFRTSSSDIFFKQNVAQIFKNGEWIPF